MYIFSGVFRSWIFAIFLKDFDIEIGELRDEVLRWHLWHAMRGIKPVLLTGDEDNISLKLVAVIENLVDSDVDISVILFEVGERQLQVVCVNGSLLLAVIFFYLLTRCTLIMSCLEQDSVTRLW